MEKGETETLRSTYIYSVTPEGITREGFLTTLERYSLSLSLSLSPSLPPPPPPPPP